jgi:hypothetical protein
MSCAVDLYWGVRGQVICLDNFFTGSKDNIAHHIGKYNFELIRHDVVNPIFLEVDQVYHLACPASPVHYKFNPVRLLTHHPTPTLPALPLTGCVSRPTRAQCSTCSSARKRFSRVWFHAIELSFTPIQSRRRYNSTQCTDTPQQTGAHHPM